jgi:hypothetical protein
MSLAELQREMAAAIMMPLTADEDMRATLPMGGHDEVAAGFIAPNSRLTAFERLEIYNRQYWFRVLDALAEDFPALRAVVGSRAFEELSIEYLTAHPSRSFSACATWDRSWPSGLRSIRNLRAGGSGWRSTWCGSSGPLSRPSTMRSARRSPSTRLPRSTADRAGPAAASATAGSRLRSRRPGARAAQGAEARNQRSGREARRRP